MKRERERGRGGGVLKIGGQSMCVRCQSVIVSCVSWSWGETVNIMVPPRLRGRLHHRRLNRSREFRPDSAPHFTRSPRRIQHGCFWDFHRGCEAHGLRVVRRSPLEAHVSCICVFRGDVGTQKNEKKTSLSTLNSSRSATCLARRRYTLKACGLKPVGVRELSSSASHAYTQLYCYVQRL